jgi:hypothetical protein
MGDHVRFSAKGLKDETDTAQFNTKKTAYTGAPYDY